MAVNPISQWMSPVGVGFSSSWSPSGTLGSLFLSELSGHNSRVKFNLNLANTTAFTIMAWVHPMICIDSGCDKSVFLVWVRAISFSCS